MTVSALRWFKAALLLQIALVGYWLAMQTVDLSPWNDLSAAEAGDALRAVFVWNGLPLLACMALFALGVELLGWLAVAGYAVWLAREAWVWWWPYAIGADDDWKAHYAASFSRTMKVLPADATHLAPDAQHLALQGLAILAIAAAAMAAARMRHL